MQDEIFQYAPSPQNCFTRIMLQRKLQPKIDLQAIQNRSRFVSMYARCLLFINVPLLVLTQWILD